MTEKTLLSVLQDFFLGRGHFVDLGVEAMRQGYAWNHSNYTETTELKQSLHREWLAADQDIAARVALAKTIVQDWGGIAGNRPGTLKRYCSETDLPEADIPFAGIASRSKILNIADPERFAILDARVVIALTAVQIIDPPQDGLLFPYLPSRNTKLGRDKGFLGRPEYRRDALIAAHPTWTKVPRDTAYGAYLRLLRQAMPDVPVGDLEMTLFAQVTDLLDRLPAQNPSQG